MARIEFPTGLVGTENLPRTHRTLKNCFNNGSGSIIGRPGISEIATIGGVARGSFTWNDSLYVVYSQELRKITNIETGAYTVIGEIAGPDRIEADVGFTQAVIVVKGGNSYTLDVFDTLTDTSLNPNFVPFTNVCHINGRFIYVPADGSLPAKVSDSGDGGTIQPLAFFDAEQLPDKNNACFNFANTLYITGTDSIELFRNIDVGPVWFQNVPNSRILNGYIGGLLEYNNTFLFIGREKGQDFGIYSIAQGQAPKISNEAIDLILSTYTQGELAEAVSGRIKWRGYDLATFALRRHSFAFFGGQWFELDTVIDGISRPWAAGYITQFGGEYFTSYQDRLGMVTKTNTDYGERITRTIDIGFEEPNSDYFACQSIELGISQGYNHEVGSVAIMMSRDNVTYHDPVYRELGNLGQYSQRLIWNPPGGLGSYDGFMGVRIYTTEDVDFSADHLIANIR